MNLAYCIQCTDRVSGVIGCFIYDMNKPFEATSPVFDNVAALFLWMRDHNYSASLEGFAVANK